jgi:uncharacterized protein YrzB (UPF0473 family)
MENEIIKIKSENGEIKDYLVLAVLKWDKTNKFYIIYTDNFKELNGEYEAYAKIFDPNDLSVFKDIETDEEWDYINYKMEQIKGEQSYDRI